MYFQAIVDRSRRMASRSAMPNRSTGNGRSGNLAMSERLPPIASTVLWSMSRAAGRCAAPITRDAVLADAEFARDADLGQLLGLAKLAKRHFFGHGSRASMVGACDAVRKQGPAIPPPRLTIVTILLHWRVARRADQNGSWSFAMSARSKRRELASDLSPATGKTALRVGSQAKASRRAPPAAPVRISFMFACRDPFSVSTQAPSQQGPELLQQVSDAKTSSRTCPCHTRRNSRYELVVREVARTNSSMTQHVFAGI